MDQPVTERRRHARFRAPVVDRIRALLRPGHVVSLVDLSAGGARIHASAPLRPGSRVHLQLLVADRRFGIAAEILRCAVASLDAVHGVSYRGALKFDSRCDVWDETPPVPAAVAPEMGASDRRGGSADLFP